MGFYAEVSQSPESSPWIVCSVMAVEGFDPRREAWLSSRMLEALHATGAVADAILSESHLVVRTQTDFCIWKLAEVDVDVASAVLALVAAPAADRLAAHASLGGRASTGEARGPRESARTGLNALWDEVEQADDPMKRGKALESFARSLLETVSQLEVRSVNVRTATSELDIVGLYRGIEVTPLALEGPYFIAECKSWSGKVNAAAIRNLATSMDRSRVALGILIAPGGVTGGDEMRDARGEIAFLWQRAPRKAILVIEQSDIEAVLGGRAMADLLQSKYEEVRFGTSPSTKKQES